MTDADKGSALRRLARRARRRRGVMYLGDDLTDEDAFRVWAPTTSRQGRRARPRPAHRVADPAGGRVLDSLADLLA